MGDLLNYQILEVVKVQTFSYECKRTANIHVRARQSGDFTLKGASSYFPYPIPLSIPLSRDYSVK